MPIKAMTLLRIKIAPDRIPKAAYGFRYDETFGEYKELFAIREYREEGWTGCCPKTGK